MIIWTVLLPQLAWSDSFARSVAPPGADMQAPETLPTLPLLSNNASQHSPDGWRTKNLADRLMTRTSRERVAFIDRARQLDHDRSRTLADGNTAASDRLAYRSDWPKPGPQGGLVDRNLTSPRTWVIEDVLHGMKKVTTIVEKDRLCLDDYFYWPVWSYAGDIYQDNWYYYSRKTLLCLGASVGGAAILANTSLDEDFRGWFQDNVATSRGSWDFGKELGNSWIVAPFLLGVWAIDEWAPPYGFFREHFWTPELGAWSRQSLRAMLVGAPTLLALQYTLGSSRPGESADGSQWNPFNDDNGVSGHTFVGAVPFLVAARRTNQFWLKAVFYTGSGLTGYSRLNDDDHYLSQVLLGWSIAYLAVEATHWTEHSNLQYRIVPLTIDGMVGVGVETRY